MEWTQLVGTRQRRLWNEQFRTVTAMAMSGGYLYVAGSITNAGGVAVQRIARWDGTNWFTLGSGITNPDGTTPSALALATNGADLYVGGLFQQAGERNSHNLARWNATTDFDTVPMIQLTDWNWTSGGPFTFTVNASGVSKFVVEATTNFSSWTPLKTNSISPYPFMDANVAGRPHQFYRARSGP